MNQDRDNTVYTYNSSITFRKYGLVLFSVALLVISSLVLYIELVDPTNSAISSSLPSPLSGLFALFVSLIFFALFSNIYPRIKLSEQGIGVEIFLFWWAIVDWQDILAIRNSVVNHKTRIIIVRRLTPIHRLFGLMYSLAMKPAFQVSPKLSGFHELMKTIELKIQSLK